MKENVLKMIIATIVAGVSAYLGVLAVPIVVLIAVMIIDYASGMIKAWFTATLSSRVGIKGIVKKLCYLMIVCVGAVADWIISTVLIRFGIEIEMTMYIGLIVTVWLIINEMISILENLSVIGIPLPDFLMKIVTKLKVTVEGKGDSNV